MKKILIVDDEPDICDLLSVMLEDEGYDVRSATNGRVCIELAESFRPEIVVTDIFMPEFDGIEVILHFRKFHPDVKLVATSRGGTHCRKEFLRDAQLLGAVATIEKPFAAPDFLELVHAVANGSDIPLSGPTVL